jgi:hypothetical protein
MKKRENITPPSKSLGPPGEDVLTKLCDQRDEIQERITHLRKEIRLKDDFAKSVSTISKKFDINSHELEEAFSENKGSLVAAFKDTQKKATILTAAFGTLLFSPIAAVNALLAGSDVNIVLSVLAGLNVLGYGTFAYKSASAGIKSYKKHKNAKQLINNTVTDYKKRLPDSSAINLKR